MTDDITIPSEVGDPVVASRGQLVILKVDPRLKDDIFARITDDLTTVQERTGVHFLVFRGDDIEVARIEGADD